MPASPASTAAANDLFNIASLLNGFIMMLLAGAAFVDYVTLSGVT